MSDKYLFLDWLEVYCLASTIDVPDPDYFRRKGWEVYVRDYGTPQYRQMFRLELHGTPMYEVRRDPYNTKMFKANMCHVRVCNKQLYTPDCVKRFVAFLADNKFKVMNISRCDIACDFLMFDDGSDPADFAKRYMANKYVKMRQRHFRTWGAEHVEKYEIDSRELTTQGTDRWTGKAFNYITWQGEGSPVNAKFYDKTAETSRDGHRKLWVRAQWPPEWNDDKGVLMHDGRRHDVWRVEFSINSRVRGLIDTDDGTIIRWSLQDLADPEFIKSLWNGLHPQYFDFRVVSGARKDRMQRKRLFDDGYTARLVKPEPKKRDITRRERMLIATLIEITKKNSGATDGQRQAAYRIIDYLSQSVESKLLNTHDVLGGMLDYSSS